MYVAVCSFDKVIRLFDYFSGEVLAQVSGHSELITALKFSLDGKYLVSVGGDGCIFVWRLSSVLVSAMQERLVEMLATAQQQEALPANDKRESAHGKEEQNHVPLDELLHVNSDDPSPRSNSLLNKHPVKKDTSIQANGDSDVRQQSDIIPTWAQPRQPVKVEHEAKRPSTALPPSGTGSINAQRIVSEAMAARPSTSAGRDKDLLLEGKLKGRRATEHSRWAKKVQESGGYELFGQKISGDQEKRKKLTLELTVRENVLVERSNDMNEEPLRVKHTGLAHTLEETDDVRLGDIDGGDGVLEEYEEDFELDVGDNNENDDGALGLSRAEETLDSLDQSARQLEEWLQKKVP